MKQIAGDLIERQQLELPQLTATLFTDQSHHYFPIPGMYGGFSYELTILENEMVLITESWCRVVEGSGQRHIITAKGIGLSAKGFV